MSLPAFDTLKFVETLQENGAFNTKQAKAMNMAFSETLNTSLVTQADLLRVESEIKSEIKEIKINFEGKFRLLHWMNGFTLAMVTTLVVKIFIN
jgi:hypothetical protein